MATGAPQKRSIHADYVCVCLVGWFVRVCAGAICVITDQKKAPWKQLYCLNQVSDLHPVFIIT
jgi:hypothetical protein